MDGSEDMSSRYLDKANRFYQIGMKNIKLQLKFLGTTFQVSRPLDTSKWKNVFGGSYSSDPTNETDYEHFTTKLLANLNDMRDVWQRNRDVMEVYSDKGDLELGDELQYTREGITYRFKVSQKLSFSEAAKNLWVYSLASIIETKDM